MEELSEALRAQLLEPHRLDPPVGIEVATGHGDNAACGDRLELGLWMEADRVRASFKASGCGAVLATASLVCSLIDARPLAEVRQLDLAQVVRAAGGLPRHRAHAERVCRRALEQALAQLAG